MRRCSAQESAAGILSGIWLALHPGASHGQSIELGEIAEDLVALEHQQCEAVLAAAISPYATVDDYKKNVRLYAREAVDGLRLSCEISRLKVEAADLSRQRLALLDEAARLEAQWQADHRLDPVNVRDYEGRDKSQRQNLADAEKIAGDIATIEADIRRLTALAERAIHHASNADHQAALELLRLIMGGKGAQTQEKI